MAALGLGLSAVAADAATQVTTAFESSQRVLGFNTIGQSGYGTDLVPDEYDWRNDGSTASSSLIGTKTINGIDRNGSPASMTLSYDSEAEVAAGGVVKVRAWAKLEDGFYNPAANQPFVIDTSFNTDPNGVPESFSVESEGRYSDSFYLSGAPSLNYVQFAFNLDGTFSGNQGGAVGLYQAAPTWGSLFNGSDYSHGSAVNERVISNPVEVVGGMASLSLYLNASVQYDFYDGFFDWPGTESLEGSADFFNTLTIAEIAGFDTHGNPVDLSSAADSLGNQFTTVRVNAVPLPAAAWLFLSALSGLLVAGRRGRLRAA